MAQYEDINEVIGKVDESNLSQATQSALTDLLKGISADKVAVVDSAEALAAAAAAATVIMMGENQSADINFAPNSPVKGIVLSGGENNVSFATSDDVVVSIQGGSSVVRTAAGDDTIGLKGGDATVDTGAGNDTVSIQGGKANITAGAGDLKVIIESNATGAATIDAGDGFDVVQVGGKASDHVFGYDATTKQFTMNSDFTLNMTDVNVVTFGDANADGTASLPYTTATVLAANPAQSLIGKLYQVALDRDNGGMDAATSTDGQLGGLDFWLDYTSANACVTQQLVYSFLNCTEFHSKYDNLSDQDYVTTLFANMGLGANDTVGGMSVADFVNSIATNTTPYGGRYDVAWALAASDETVKLIGADGDEAQYVIDGGNFDMQNPLA